MPLLNLLVTKKGWVPHERTPYGKISLPKCHLIGSPHLFSTILGPTNKFSMSTVPFIEHGIVLLGDPPCKGCAMLHGFIHRSDPINLGRPLIL